MKAQIYASHSYGCWDLSFKKTFDLPFTPFYGMELIFDDKNDYEVRFKNDDYCKTDISYNTENKKFEIFVRNTWKHPVTDDTVDYTLEKYSTWKRIDTTNIDELKELMLQDYNRTK